MANFIKTSKAEKVIITVLIILLIAALAVWLKRDKSTSPQTDLQPGEHLVEPVSERN